MNKLVAILALMICMLTVHAATAAAPLDDAASVRTQWAEAFNAGNVDKLVSLYTNDALFYGSTAPLFKGSDGVRTYFSHLPPGLKAQMGEQSVVAVEPNVLLSSGLVDFSLKDGPVASFRLTLALVKVGGQWQIVQHHASLVPKT
jgi:ketosteroid isomerase-like protein